MEFPENCVIKLFTSLYNTTIQQYNNTTINLYNNIIIHLDLVVMINDIIDYGNRILEIVITLCCSQLISVVIYTNILIKQNVNINNNKNKNKMTVTIIIITHEFSVFIFIYLQK